MNQTISQLSKTPKERKQHQKTSLHFLPLGHVWSGRHRAGSERQTRLALWVASFSSAASAAAARQPSFPPSVGMPVFGQFLPFASSTWVPPTPPKLPHPLLQHPPPTDRPKCADVLETILALLVEGKLRGREGCCPQDLQ